MRIFLVVILIFVGYTYPELNEQHDVFSYYEQKSFTPLLHLFFNRHFRTSKQFENLEIILNELKEDIRDFGEIIYTDCDKNQDQKLYSCNMMKRTKDNRDIVGTLPSQDFKTLGNLVIQSPPEVRQLRHHSDVYNKEQLLSFMEALLPNFYKQLHNKEQYQNFLLPHYVPKILLFNREDEDIPIIMKKLSVHFQLRFDFGVVYDLTEDIVPEVFDIKKYPKLIVLTYDFEKNQLNANQYNGDLSESSYYQVKKFLEPFALKQERNDLIFHKIKMDTTSEIKSAETLGQYSELLERSNGWSIVEKSTENFPVKLNQFKQKYGPYFEYIHYRAQDPNKKQLYIYHVGENELYPIEGELQFATLSFEHFQSNMSLWLVKDSIVLGVREAHAHLCSIAQKSLFRSRMRCLIIQEEGYEDLSKYINAEFDIGFTSYSMYDEQKGKVVPKGSPLTSTSFVETYQAAEYATRVKLREVLNNFMENPISQIKDNSLSEACFHPLKRCFLLLTDLSKKDRTLQAYTKQIAINFIQSYTFYQVDINSNQQLLQAMQIESTKPNIVIFYPKTNEYVKLDRKVTKALIQKFLQANLKNDKRLKKHVLKSSVNVKKRQEQFEDDEL